jgi:hypothetical protein
MIGVGAVPAPAQDQNKGTAASAPTASIAKVGVDKRRLNIRAGRRAVVVGTVQPRVAHDRSRPHRKARPLSPA